ncbi:AAA family ATPase [Litorivicinus lipolyticus]|uniref:AAA family ATPase n=1 Tax=Litorivicinus lipolyticus TaxID=418701 RepID=A0A5Q2Q622_9GAMM|nr:ParA family protein [Litorivicinus lipolyticus]QGG79138.1 AAA family ATPase [Litorivicinus lipolyticus]
MPRIISVTNQKGGVGKTTTAVNMASAFAATGRRTLLIDLDPQGNATTGSGISKNDVAYGLYDLIINHVPLASCVLKPDACGYELIPGNGDTTAAEIQLLSEPDRQHQLKKALVDHPYEMIVIDCPPSLNMMTINALVASHGVVIPVQCEFFALEGLADLLETIDDVRETFNPSLAIDGVLRTMYDPRSSLTSEVSRQIRTYFDKKMFTTVIPRNVRLAEAPSHGLPAIQYDRKSRGAISYLALAGEYFRKVAV